MSKYEPLQRYLEQNGSSRVPMTFREIEKVLGASLPASSRKHRAWWSNNPTNNVMTYAWLNAGYATEEVDLAAEKLTFRKAATVVPSSPPVASGSSSERRPSISSTAEERGTPAADTDRSAIMRHPAFGALKGWLVIPVDVDLTEPADPDWGKVYE